jgi:hypothetical protein
VERLVVGLQLSNLMRQSGESLVVNCKQPEYISKLYTGWPWNWGKVGGGGVEALEEAWHGSWAQTVENQPPLRRWDALSREIRQWRTRSPERDRLRPSAVPRGTDGDLS